MAKFAAAYSLLNRRQTASVASRWQTIAMAGMSR
jgi:hypothetical protein